MGAALGAEMGMLSTEPMQEHFAKRPRKAMITAAITGHRTSKDMARNLPVLCEEQVRAAVECVGQGASILHLHVCEENPHEVISTVAASRYLEVLCALHMVLPDLVVEITCRGVDTKADATGLVIERGNLVMLESAMWGHNEKFKPEIVALNVSTRNIDKKTIIVNSSEEVIAQINRIYELGCIPRCDVYDIGDILATKRWLELGILRAPVHYLLIFGSYSGIGVEKKHVDAMVAELPEGAIWTALGTGRYNFPIAEYCAQLGGHLRTGFEDCTFISKDVKAESNAQLVGKVAELARSHHVEPATISEARKLMGLPLTKMAVDK